jgi:hypothetical protein
MSGYYDNYDKRIAEQLKRIADALDELNKRERERGTLLVSVPVYIPQPFRWPWQQTWPQPGLTIGTGPRTVGDPPYTTSSASIQWDGMGNGTSPVGTFTFKPHSDDGDVTTVGEPSAR